MQDSYSSHESSEQELSTPLPCRLRVGYRSQLAQTGGELSHDQDRYVPVSATLAAARVVGLGDNVGVVKFI